MTVRRRWTGWAVLVGFLAITGWASGLGLASCCSPASCESCPATFCKDGPADRCPRAAFDAHLNPVPGYGAFVLTQPSETPASFQLPVPCPTGFHRPMRN